MQAINYLTLYSSNIASLKTSNLQLSTLTGSTMTLTTSITAPAMTASTLIVSSINGLLPGTGSGSSTWLTGTGGIIYYNGGNVGIGTSTNIANFQIYGASNPNITLGNSTYTSDFQIAMASAGGNYSSSAIAGDTIIRTISGNLMLQAMGGGNAAIYISRTNNYVGIGMATPGYPLDVNGAARITSGLLIAGTNVINFGYDQTKEANAGKIGYQTFTTGALDIIGAGATTRLIKLWDNVGVAASLGVGTTTPITKFNVVGGESVFNGNLYLNSNANTVTPNPATYWGVGVKMAAEDNGYTGSDLNVYVSWQGGAWYKGFNFNNSGYAYNYRNSWGGLSDINMKENIVDARNYLDDVRSLRVVKYSLKVDQLTEPNQLGLIAQEVETIFPKLVSTDKDGIKYLKTSIIGMMQLKSIQELADKNDALETKNAELRQKLEALLAWAQTQGFSGTF